MTWRENNPSHHVATGISRVQDPPQLPSPLLFGSRHPGASGLGAETPERRKVQKLEDQGPGEGRGLVQVIQDRLCRSQGAYSWLLARGRGPGRRHPGPGPSFLLKVATSEFPRPSPTLCM